MNTKLAVITGASTGIGQAIAVELGRQGITVYLVARREDRLRETKQQVENAGGQAEIFVTDLTRLDSINNLLSQIKDKTDHVDILFNIAGLWHGQDEVYVGKDFDKFDQKIVVDTMMVDLIAPTLLVHGVVALLKKGSSIINISGTFEDGAKGWLTYYVSKRAVEDLTVGLSQELGDKGIRVNCISPSDVSTEEYKKYFPEYAKNALSPEEVAQFALELVSKEISGKVYVIKKGQDPKEMFHK